MLGRNLKADSDVSHASGSSTKTHRRLAIEVSSILFKGSEESYLINTSQRSNIIDSYSMNPIVRSDQIASTSYCISMQVSSDDVKSSTDSEVKVGLEPRNKSDPAHYAAELIRELSFSCDHVSSSSYQDCSYRHKLEALVAEESDQPTTIPPPLPPIIRRLEMSQIIDMPSNRNLTRSKSISEMSDSDFNDDLIIENITEFEMEDHDHNDMFSVQKSTCLRSIQDHRFISSRGDEGAVLRKQMLRKPRLTSETLKEWDMLCEGIHPNDAFPIFRARSCPDRVRTAPLPCECCNDSVQESGIRHMISQSMFSYTNSDSSSITSSNEDVRSNLDFDVNLFAPIHNPDPDQFSPKRQSV